MGQNMHARAEVVFARHVSLRIRFERALRVLFARLSLPRSQLPLILVRREKKGLCKNGAFVILHLDFTKKRHKFMISRAYFLEVNM